jgi:hypothetical protein
MLTDIKIPDYLEIDFSMYLENMSSLTDPESPDLLKNYLADLYKQLEKNSGLFTGLVDQLAMAITMSIRIDSKKLVLLDLSDEPQWLDIKPFVGVHAHARTTITEIMAHSEHDLKIAVLLIHFYNTYDATPLPEDEEEFETGGDSDDDYNTTYEGDEYE